MAKLTKSQRTQILEAVSEAFWNLSINQGMELNGDLTNEIDGKLDMLDEIKKKLASIV